MLPSSIFERRPPVSETVQSSPPPGLGERGGKFWSELHESLEFEPHESALVLEACRTLDRIEALEHLLVGGLASTGSTGQTVVHPAVAELRQQQAGFARLMAAVNMPADVAAADRFRLSRAHAGAAARWERPKAVG